MGYDDMMIHGSGTKTGSITDGTGIHPKFNEWIVILFVLFFGGSAIYVEQ